MELIKLLTNPVVIAIAVGAYILHSARSYFKLSQFRGPPMSGWSNLPHSKALWGDAAHLWYAGVVEKYGTVARIAPNLLITSSPEAWAHINKEKRYKRSDWYYNALRGEYRKDNVFSQADNQKHDERRKQMMPGYSGRENLDLEPTIDDRVKELINLIRTKYISTDKKIVPMDLARKIQYFTLDVISSIGFGKKFGMLETDSDVDHYIESMTEGFYTLKYALAIGVSWLVQAPVIGWFLAPSHKRDDGFGKMMAACFKAVDDRLASPTDKRSDMLASFIRNGLEGDELRSEALIQIVAGSDTTSAGIRGILLHIITNPLVYAKLQKEIDAFEIEDDRIISLTESRSLPYMQAVIREGLRIEPPVANYFARDVPAGGDNVPIGDGKTVFLPGGSVIGHAAVAIHKSTKTYGEDAALFRPERWFETDAAKLEEMTRVNDLVFGHGRWKCLGKPVAQIEIVKIVFEFLRNFDWTTLEPAKPWHAVNLFGLFDITDMPVQVNDRRAKA